MKKLLIVEDDAQINGLLKKLVEEYGYEADSVYDGGEAIRLAAQAPEAYSLVLLDLMLPHVSGESVLRRLRELSAVPVIVLSAKSDVQDRVSLIRQGADDFVTKPFDLNEVMARIEAVLRRTGGFQEERVLRYQNLTVNPSEGSVLAGGVPVSLSAKEFAILALLMRYPRKLFSKANIFESVWNEPYYAEGELVKVHVNRLRKKLQEASPGHEYIETVWGMGYRMQEE